MNEQTLYSLLWQPLSSAHGRTWMYDCNVCPGPLRCRQEGTGWEQQEAEVTTTPGYSAPLSPGGTWILSRRGTPGSPTTWTAAMHLRFLLKYWAEQSAAWTHRPHIQGVGRWGWLGVGISRGRPPSRTHAPSFFLLLAKVIFLRVLFIKQEQPKLLSPSSRVWVICVAKCSDNKVYWTERRKETGTFFFFFSYSDSTIYQVEKHNIERM